MTTNNTFWWIAGYVIGGSLFLLLVPYGLYLLSGTLGQYRDIPLMEEEILRIVLAAVLFSFGMCFAIWSLVALYKIGKGGPLQGAGIEVSPKSKKLVITGPYRYTRNPMMFGACSYYYSLAVFMNSFSYVITVSLFVVVALAYVKLSEEKRLMRDFGDEFLQYREKVSFFIPIPGK